MRVASAEQDEIEAIAESITTSSAEENKEHIRAYKALLHAFENLLLLYKHEEYESKDD